MKLVDILARELKEWPEGFNGCDNITQDDDGLLNSTGTGCVPNLVGGTWRSGSSSYIENGQGGELPAELACDWDTAIVTRAQWQAAVDALNAGDCDHSHSNSLGCPECGQAFDWEGGLPPEGAACEGYIYADTEKYATPNNQWAKGVFIGTAYSENGGAIGLLKTEDGRVHAISAFSYFRPTRTAEQIAAEEREDAIREMLNYDIKLGREIAEWLYDAGYRKQVQP